MKLWEWLWIAERNGLRIDVLRCLIQRIMSIVIDKSCVTYLSTYLKLRMVRTRSLIAKGRRKARFLIARGIVPGYR